MKTKPSPRALAGIGIACAVLAAAFVIWISRAVQAQSRPDPTPSGNLAADRIATNRYFSARLVWVGDNPPSQEESRLLLEILEQWKASGAKSGLVELEEFVHTLTNSAWSPSLHANLGHYYRTRGQTTRALAHWQRAWDMTREFTHGTGKQVADFALAHLTRLLMVFGRSEDLAEIYQTYGDRVLDRGPLSQMWLRTHEKHLRMLKSPGDSYKCGLYALDQVARTLRLKYNRSTLLNTPSKAAGFSLEELQALSSRFGFGLVPVRRLSESGRIVVPSVVHWRQEHYAAIIGRQGETYELADPSGLGVAWLTAEEINAEASGYFMLPNQELGLDFVRLSAWEAASVVGRASSCPPEDGEDIQCRTCPCLPGTGGSPTGRRAAVCTGRETDPGLIILLNLFFTAGAVLAVRPAPKATPACPLGV